MFYCDFSFDTNQEACCDEVEFWGKESSAKTIFKSALKSAEKIELVLKNSIKHPFCFPSKNADISLKVGLRNQTQ